MADSVLMTELSRPEFEVEREVWLSRLGGATGSTSSAPALVLAAEKERWLMDGSPIQETLAVSPKVQVIRDEMIATAARPLAQAVTLPREAYIDEDYFQFEAACVLAAGWLAIAHVSELAEPGSFLALDLLGEPLLVVRDRGGQVRVVSRVCAHRAMDIMPDGFDYPRKGSINLISCPYHRWTYDLDGSLRGCPHMQWAEGFDRADWRLAQIRSEVWHGFVFVNLDGKAEPLSQQYADFSRIIAPWRTEEMEIVIGLEWDCRFNWKVMLENWLESYHHVGAHSTTLNPVMPGENTWTEPEHPHFIRAHLPFTEHLMRAIAREEQAGAAQPRFRPVEGLSLADRTEWGLYVGYPCFMFLTMADRVLWYRLLPVSAQHCKLETITLVARENRGTANFAALVESETKMLREFHTEDMVVNTAVQRGLQSSKAVRGRLSHLEEPIWLMQRYLAARAGGGYPAKADRAPYSGPLAGV